MPRTNYTDPLDEILDKLNSGSFTDQSPYEFTETVKSYTQNKKARTTTAYKRNLYSTVKPVIKGAVETANYDSRYQQVTECLNNIDYSGYSDEKAEGYRQGIQRYLELISQNVMDLRPVETQVAGDISTCQAKLKSTTVDNFFMGYYDSLLMVKKVLFNSKIARLRELSNKLS